MNQKSKFHIGNVYIWFIFLVTAIGCVLYFIIRSIILQVDYSSNFAAASVSLIVFILTGFALFRLIKSMKSLDITPNEIIIRQLFKKGIINQNEIEEIDLFARMNSSIFSNRSGITGISITTKSAENFFFQDLYYQNVPALKSALFHNFAGFIRDRVGYNRKSGNTFSLRDMEPKIFSGNFIFSFNGALIILPFILCLVIFKNETSYIFQMVMILYLLCFFVIVSFRAYYFIIQDNKLEIRNQIWRWKKTVYEMDKIKSIFIEKPYRQSNVLRINTTDFHSRSFQAGSLRDKTWRLLISEFEAKGIEVCNDSFI